MHGFHILLWKRNLALPYGYDSLRKSTLVRDLHRPAPYADMDRRMYYILHDQTEKQKSLFCVFSPKSVINVFILKVRISINLFLPIHERLGSVGKKKDAGRVF